MMIEDGMHDDLMDHDECISGDENDDDDDDDDDEDDVSLDSFRQWTIWRYYDAQIRNEWPFINNTTSWIR